MIYLSQLLLNPLNRQVQSELAFPYEMHRTLQRAFGSDRESADVLFRIDQTPQTHTIALLVQANCLPDWDYLSESRKQYLLQPPAIKEVTPQFQPEMRFRFRLQANPSKKQRRTGENGQKLHSNRVPHLTPEAQISWLQNQAVQHGFELLSVEVNRPIQQRDARHHVTIATVQFDGFLRVQNSERFHEAYHKGIGPAKAFGCGLLSLGRI